MTNPLTRRTFFGLATLPFVAPLAKLLGVVTKPDKAKPIDRNLLVFPPMPPQPHEFWSSDTMPTENIGPGFLNGTQLYVWATKQNHYIRVFT